MTDKKIAYFCMEYGINNKLPLYAGGLGILAGDYLKAAFDKEKPIIGIGIRWWQDYTEQYIDQNGSPYDKFPIQKLDFLKKVDKTIKIKIAEKEIKCNIYKVDNFNNATLYLLDAGQPGSENGWITDKLYDGDDKKRIAQEMVLGIGGIRLLRKLNIEIDNYHFNEGHAAFAGFELIKEKIKNGLSFEKALNEIRNEVVFTTHTPVVAGNETHNINLLKKMGAENHLTEKQLIKIGGKPFNMTAACLHMSGLANGVSRLHGLTANKMWKELTEKPPIIHVTNGVHRPTWQKEKIARAYLEKNKLFYNHNLLKQKLIDFIENKTNAKMNKDHLIIGFARRAAPYKRSELIFRNTEKISKLLSDKTIQLVFSGKAHPDDQYGKNIVSTLVKMDRKYRDSVVFLENYDMKIASFLTSGCDLWLNNPKRPLEASGTSGMKAALNGVLNLSVLDGWVDEGLEHNKSGWILDSVFPELNDSLGEDKKDLLALYRIIEKEVIPIYYEEKDRWEEMMYASIKMAKDKFTAARMLDDYYQKMYNQI